MENHIVSEGRPQQWALDSFTLQIHRYGDHVRNTPSASLFFAVYLIYVYVSKGFLLAAARPGSVLVALLHARARIPTSV